jgi:hypothetical protein
MFHLFLIRPGNDGQCVNTHARHKLAVQLNEQPAGSIINEQPPGSITDQQVITAILNTASFFTGSSLSCPLCPSYTGFSVCLQQTFPFVHIFSKLSICSCLQQTFPFVHIFSKPSHLFMSSANLSIGSHLQQTFPSVHILG